MLQIAAARESGERLAGRIRYELHEESRILKNSVKTAPARSSPKVLGVVCVDTELEKSLAALEVFAPAQD